METDEIINYLYNEYYLKDRTPPELVSSFWKYYQNQQKVQIKDGKVEALIATPPLGGLDIKSPVHRFLSWLTIGSYLWKLADKKGICSLVKTSLRVTKRMGLFFTYECFRQMCSLVLIRRHLKKRKRINVIIIGDGYGFFSSLIKEIYPDSRILLVDLGWVLLFQTYYCAKAHPDAEHYLVTPSAKLVQNQLDYDFIYCPAENLNLVDSLSFDLAINTISMQEMNKETIEFYFNYLRQNMASQNLFYCCNREKKELPSGDGVEFLKYLWSENDVHLVDEYSPWHTHFVSLHTLKNGPKLLNFRIPFINYFDGPHRHRLSKLYTERRTVREQAR